MNKKVVQVVYDTYINDPEYLKLKTSLVPETGASNRPYCFFTDDPDLKVNDIVVLHSNTIDLSIGTVVKVEGLTDREIKMASKWIVQKVDLKAHLDRLKKDEVIQEIRNQLREKADQMREMVLYQQLAATDPTIKALIDRLSDLDPTLVPSIDTAKGQQLDNLSEITATPLPESDDKDLA